MPVPVSVTRRIAAPFSTGMRTVTVPAGRLCLMAFSTLNLQKVLDIWTRKCYTGYTYEKGFLFYAHF